jgi:redox-sensitive bicupin YhaK (pirin superfamily)
MPIDSENTCFIYIVEGSGYFDEDLSNHQTSHRALLFHEGDDFLVQAAEEGIRFLLLSAKPLKEPIAWGGPIVMNTEEELELAFREIRNNTFIK